MIILENSLTGYYFNIKAALIFLFFIYINHEPTKSLIKTSLQFPLSLSGFWFHCFYMLYGVFTPNAKRFFMQHDYKVNAKTRIDAKFAFSSCYHSVVTQQFLWLAFGRQDDSRCWQLLTDPQHDLLLNTWPFSFKLCVCLCGCIHSLHCGGLGES